MNKVITVLVFLALTATGAALFACGDSPANPPPQAPTGGGAPASSSAQPTTAPAPKGGW